MEKFQVDRSQLKSLLSGMSPEEKLELAVKYPDDDIGIKILEFGDQIKITTEITDHDLFIGRGIAPTGLADKCLMFDGDYDVVIKDVGGYKALVFFKQK
jgi:hypothetical protein